MPEPSEYDDQPQMPRRPRSGGIDRHIDLGTLNPRQLEAVTCDRRHLLVVAGAGSGKTRTLTYRVAYLVEKGVSPQSILLLTFTRKAAQEMLQRASALLDGRCRDIVGGTFHAFAFHQLRRHAHNIGLPCNFNMLDRKDMEDLIALACKELLTGDLSSRPPRKSTLASIFSRAVNVGLPIEDIVYEDYPHLGLQIEDIYKIWEAYRQKKQDHLYFDFDDLLIHLRRLLSEDDVSTNRLRHRFRYILVDEYQDTNTIQADIVSRLVGTGQRLMVVGDEAQSIYGFRGAVFENMIAFSQRYPGTHVIKLEQNYRSVQPILDLANAIIHQAAHKHAKHLFTCRDGGRSPLLIATADEHIQSRYVVNEISRLAARGLRYRDIAILFRAGHLAFDMELELARRRIPFQKYGGFKFSESAHIKDFIAHLKILTAPSDRISWYRVLRLIPTIGAKTAQKIYEAIAGQDGRIEGRRHLPSGLRKIQALEPLLKLLDDLNPDAAIPVLLGEAVLAYYRPHLETRHDDHPRRLRDLQQILSIMERYDRLADFMADMALEPPDISIEGQLAGGRDVTDRLTLSTIHSAKGLEWKVVFLIWALDGRFPGYRALEHEAEMEEERRLMYVAVTRARDTLVITYPVNVYDRAAGCLLNEPSRFLEGMGEGVMQTHYVSAADV